MLWLKRNCYGIAETRTDWNTRYFKANSSCFLSVWPPFSHGCEAYQRLSFGVRTCKFVSHSDVNYMESMSQRPISIFSRYANLLLTQMNSNQYGNNQYQFSDVSLAEVMPQRNTLKYSSTFLLSCRRD